MSSGIFLSLSALANLSASAQGEILACLGINGAPVTASAIAAAQEDGPVELTLALVRKLTEGLSGKTLEILKLIAQGSTPKFHMKDAIAVTQGAQNYMDMRGVWSALTRRTRNIMNDSDVDLIWWLGDQIEDAGGNYVDHIGTVSAMTHASLRTHFKL